MKRKIEYQISDLERIMEEYADVNIQFTNREEENNKGFVENVVYLELGQSLDIFGLDDVYYDAVEKRYFIFFSVFLHHLNQATDEVHSSVFTFNQTEDERTAIVFEAG